MSALDTTTNNSYGEQIDKYHSTIAKYIQTSEEQSSITFDDDLQLSLTALFDSADILSEKEPKKFSETFLPFFIQISKQC
ncbi:unnamed protein product [Hanseniaspora opuntiae]